MNRRRPRNGNLALEVQRLAPRPLDTSVDLSLTQETILVRDSHQRPAIRQRDPRAKLEVAKSVRDGEVDAGFGERVDEEGGTAKVEANEAVDESECR